MIEILLAPPRTGRHFAGPVTKTLIEKVLAGSYLVEEGHFTSPDESYCQMENYAVVASFDSTGLDIW
ncbi:MAG: hypothetical protein M0Z58_02045, partial [Nitrospiraceae bacterium]|nr:hypothetical protein [Nitrospiraceae bacterium]